MRRLVLVLSLLVLMAPAVGAQGGGAAATVVADSAVQRAAATRWRAWPPRQVVFFTGAAFNSPGGGVLGSTPRRDFYLLGVSARWRLFGSERIGLSYIVDAVPLSIVTGNPSKLMAPDECRYRVGIADGEAVDYHDVCGLGRRNAYGAGLLPFGLAFRIRAPSGITLASDLATGAILFDRPMPYPDAARLNYVVAVGAALELAVARGTVITAGYRLHHVSNGGSAEYNPGVGARLLYVGIGRVRGGSRAARSAPQ